MASRRRRLRPCLGLLDALLHALGVGAQPLRQLGDPRLVIGHGRHLLGRARGRTHDPDIVDAGRHHRDPDDPLQALVEGRPDDDVGVLIDLFADPGRGLVDFVQGEVLAARDRDQQPARALHRHVVDQRIGDGGFGGAQRALLARRLAGPHHGLAHLAHDRAHVGKVEVDEAFLHHQVGDAGHARIEHLVGHREGVREGGLLVRHPEQVLVGNDDQRVDDLLQLGDAGFRAAHPALAFEVERLGHHPDGENPELARHPRDDRRRAGAGAAAHAGGDEHHVGAAEMIADLIDHFLGRRAADIRLRAGAETLGDLNPHLDDALGLGQRERLGVGVGDDEIDALQPGGDHVVDGVAAGATDTEHCDARLEFTDVGDLQVDAHGCLFIARATPRGPPVRHRPIG